MSRTKVTMTMAVAALLLAAPLFAQEEAAEKTTPTPAELEAKVDAYIAPYLETGNYSGAIVIAKGGEILLNKGYGLANYEYDEPCTATTKFPMGSIGKQVTAIAIMQLVDQDKVKLDDKIKKYLPKYRYGDQITVHHLLTHTSGVPELPESSPYRGSFQGREISDNEARFEQLNKQKLDFRPGSQYKYTNIGYWLLSEIVARASGMKADDYLMQNVIGKAGMSNTYRDIGQIIHGRSTGHFWSHRGLIKSYYFEKPLPGAYFTTAEDLYKMNRGVIDGTLVSPESRDKMFTKHNDVYGYAFFVNESDGLGKVVWHGGNSIGYRGNVLNVLSKDLSIVVFTNVYNCPFSKIVNDVANLAMGEEVTPYAAHKMVDNIPHGKFSLYEGSFRGSDRSSIYRIVYENDGLFLDMIQQSRSLGTQLVNRMALFPIAEDHFFLMDMPAEVFFPQSEPGRQVEEMIFISNGANTELRRIGSREEREIGMPSLPSDSRGRDEDDPIPPR